jgi:murein DD-endopeptidase MepM/ murein hydrolase activator NlpD
MRLFSGSRDSGKAYGSKATAGDVYKNKLNAILKGRKPKEKTPDEKYKELVDAKMQKLVEDTLMGVKKGGLRLPGTKAEDNKPKELSKNAKLMLEMLAVRKAKSEIAMDRKKELQEKRAKKAKQYAEAQEKARKDAAAELELRRLQDEAAAAAAAAAAASTDSNGGWWNGNGW